MIQEKTIGELAAEDYRKAEVFKKFGIDFCCGGKKSVREVCEKKGVDYAALEKDLLLAEMKGNEAANENFNEWELDALADYIVQTHHAYVKENIPLLLEFSQKVAAVHGNANPEVVEIAKLFQQVACEMQQHMMKEENVLFPYIREMVRKKKEGGQAAQPHFSTVKNPIRMMEAEHDLVGDLLKQINLLQ